MKQRALQGKRYIGLLRCSTREQADTSIVDQRRVLEAFARDQGLVHVDDVVLGGVSGSLPGACDHIPQLIQRKQEADDFDLLVIQDTSRLTRSGTKHLHYLEWMLLSAGIKVLYATGRNADGWVGELETSFNAGVDQAAARAISFDSARGSMSAILDGRSSYCRRPPYAIDRLYVTPDETPLHIIRNLPNGRQLQLHPETRDVIREFGANEGAGVPNHYIKQKQEHIVLVPGDHRCVETLRRMYRRHHVDGLGRYRIAKELNEAGVLSPSGKKWSTFAIGAILRNPIYLGRGIANRYTSAVYHKRSDDCPLPVEVDPSDLCNRKRPALRTRPEPDWRYRDYPQLAELIEPEVREIAAASQQAYLEGQAGGPVPKPNRDRHRNSSFFLKGIVHANPTTRHIRCRHSGLRCTVSRGTRVQGCTIASQALPPRKAAVSAMPLAPVLDGAKSSRRFIRVFGENEQAYRILKFTSMETFPKTKLTFPTTAPDAFGSDQYPRAACRAATGRSAQKRCPRRTTSTNRFMLPTPTSCRHASAVSSQSSAMGGHDLSVAIAGSASRGGRRGR